MEVGSLVVTTFADGKEYTARIIALHADGASAKLRWLDDHGNATKWVTRSRPLALCKISKPFEVCVVCFEASRDVVKCGRPGQEAPVCKTCINAHVKTTLDYGYDGRIPRIKDPVDASLLLPFAVSSSFTDTASVNIIKRRSAAVLSLQCGSCHNRRDLMVDAVPQLKSSAALKEPLALCDPDFESFSSAREDFLRGSMTENEFYLILRKLFSTSVTVGDKDGPCKIMTVILQSIQDPERRASLHMVYLKEFPDVHTKCCQRRHCFRCHIKDFHPGQTCEQYQASIATVIDVVPCPTCGLQLTKGDGCNSVNCVCGRNFDWATELRKLQVEMAKVFTEEHPDDPALAATLMAYQNSDDPRPRAFTIINQSVMAPARAKLWEMLYPYWPAEAALSYSQLQSPSNGHTNAEHKAMAVAYSTSKPMEVNACLERQKVARGKMFLAAHGGDREKALGAARRQPVKALSRARDEFLEGINQVEANATAEATFATHASWRTTNQARITENLALAWDCLHNPKSAEDAALVASECGAGGDTQEAMVAAFVGLYPERLDNARSRRFAASWPDPVARVVDLQLSFSDLDFLGVVDAQEVKDMEAFHWRHAAEVAQLKDERAQANARDEIPSTPLSKAKLERNITQQLQVT